MSIKSSIAEKKTAGFEEIPDLWPFSSTEIVCTSSFKHSDRDENYIIQCCKTFFDDFLNEIFEKKLTISQLKIETFFASLKLKLNEIPDLKNIKTCYDDFISK